MEIGPVAPTDEDDDPFESCEVFNLSECDWVTVTLRVVEPAATFLRGSATIESVGTLP